METSLKAGFSKSDITVYEPEMAMLGWGQIDNRIRGVHTPLSARVLVLSNGEQRLILLTAELALITLALRQAVLRELESDGVRDSELMLSATHTHSGPSGYSHYLAYNVSNYGYSPLVFHTLVRRFATAIRRATEALRPAQCRWAQAAIPLSEPLAFNRSLASYNRNSGTSRASTAEEAVDRRSSTLRVDAADGSPMGLVNWFGVHGTSIHADNTFVHPDNKGVAAKVIEEAMPPGFVAIFAQEASGDVSPNYRFDPSRRLHVGSHESDLDSVQFNGELQAKYALGAWKQAAEHSPLQEELTSQLRYVDLAQGGPIVMGLPMAAGTAEGPGPLRPVAPLFRAASGLRLSLGARNARLPWISMERGADGRFLGVIPMRLGFAIMAPVEPMIAFVRAADRAGWVGDVPWVPPVVPVQAWRFGKLAIGGLPIEPTTVAGRRLRAELVNGTAEHAVLTTYANAYAGYLTTPEEFQRQGYEGGASYFGPDALPVLEQELRCLTQPSPSAPSPHRPVTVEEDFLIAQRRAGRSGVNGPGTDAFVPPGPVG